MKAYMAKNKIKKDDDDVSRVEPAKLESDSSYMVLAVKVLLVLLILFSLPKLVTTQKTTKTEASKEKQQKPIFYELRVARFECQNNPIISSCMELIPEESLNCIHQCMSESCYDTIYGTNPLEPGEIDIDRAKEFETCVKNEMRHHRAQRNTGNKIKIE